MKKFYYIVGINGREMPNPDDWFSRWDCIHAANEEEAIQLYFEQHKTFLRDQDKELIEVHDLLLEYEPPYDYLIKRNHIS